MLPKWELNLFLDETYVAIRCGVDLLQPFYNHPLLVAHINSGHHFTQLPPPTPYKMQNNIKNRGALFTQELHVLKGDILRHLQCNIPCPTHFYSANTHISHLFKNSFDSEKNNVNRRLLRFAQYMESVLLENGLVCKVEIGGKYEYAVSVTILHHVKQVQVSTNAIHKAIIDRFFGGSCVKLERSFLSRSDDMMVYYNHEE
jgi:hypothetical protein